MPIPACKAPPSESSGMLLGRHQVADVPGLYGWCLLPAIPSSPAFARAYIRMIIKWHEVGVDADAAEWVASEMVSNALQHAYHGRPSMSDTVHVGLGLWQEGLMIAVGDMSESPPTLRPMMAEAESGRGLHVIEALSEDWGWVPQEGGGKVVFAIIAEGSGRARRRRDGLRRSGRA